MARRGTLRFSHMTISAPFGRTSATNTMSETVDFPCARGVLLEACRELRSGRSELEDVVIARLHRRGLSNRGIRFAPEEVARRFSYERTLPTEREFGFHGAFNLVRYLPGDEAARLFQSLEPGMLARNERWELLRWALCHGRLSLATTMLVRIMRG